MKPTIKSNYRSTFHRDNTISFWDVFCQQWRRISLQSFSDREIATMRSGERERIISERANAGSQESNI